MTLLLVSAGRMVKVLGQVVRRVEKEMLGRYTVYRSEGNHVVGLGIQGL